MLCPLDMKKMKKMRKMKKLRQRVLIRRLVRSWPTSHALPTWSLAWQGPTMHPPELAKIHLWFYEVLLPARALLFAYSISACHSVSVKTVTLKVDSNISKQLIPLQYNYHMSECSDYSDGEYYSHPKKYFLIIWIAELYEEAAWPLDHWSRGQQCILCIQSVQKDLMQTSCAIISFV